ncbi:hypothetical protein ACR79R_21340 [Sphingobacterium spiritivorum]|uniref:hypothetical protein n=1 Tax=Sphingobacterium spiritivorum TaxID=258 RepID=UPI003DA6C3FF
MMLCGIAFAQTQPNLPTGSTPYSSNLFKSPDGSIWTGKAGNYTALATKAKLDSLYNLGYTKAQVDALITGAKNRSNHTGTQAISTIEDLQTFLDSKIPVTQKAASNGVATLDANSKIPMSQVPDALIGSVNYQGNWNPATNLPTLPVTPGTDTKGHYYIASVTGTFNGVEYNNGDWIISNGSVWGKVDNTNKVVSVNGKQGAVVLTLSDIAGTTDLVTLNTAQNITAKKTFKTANATSGNGISPIEVIGGNGASVVATSGFAMAGNAAPINITSGNGGFSNGTNPSGTNSGGSGGEISIVAGNAGPAMGSANNINGFGGNVILQAGTSFGNGKAGNVQIKAGNNDTGIGGDIYLTTGYGQGGINDDTTAGNVYMGLSAAENSRGHVIVGGIPSDNNGNKLQVYGKASVSQAPTAPTDVVRLSDLQSSIGNQTLQSVISRGNLINPGDQNAFAWNRSDGPDNKWGLKYDETYNGMNFVRYGLQDGVLFLRDVNNYVGIGTVVPAYKLHVNGDFGVGNMYTEGALRFFNPSGNINTRRHWLQANANTNGDFSIYSQNNDGSGNRFDFYISPLGNIGLGTVDPQYKLHVNGEFASYGADFGSRIRMFGTPEQPNSRRWFLQPNLNAWGDLGIYSQNNSGTGDRYDFLIKENGNIGIGTLTPSAKLEVAGAIKTSDKTVSNILSYTGSSGVVGTESSHPLDFWTGSTSKMTILTNGNVGVGTTTPSAKLYVNGDALASNLIINNSPGTYRELQFKSNGVLRWDVFASPTAESGGNLGSDFAITRYADDGGYLGQSFSIARSTGNATFGNNLDVSGALTANGTIRSNQGFSAYASVNSQATYRPTGITFNPAANTYATIDANTSGGLTIRTADGSATAQIRMTFLTPNGATARSVMLSGRAYYGGDYSGAFEANDLIPKKYVDDKIQLITLRTTISGGVAILDGGAVQSGYRYIVQGASLYNGTTPEFLSLSKLAIQAGTTGNVVAQYETTSVDNGKDVEVLILKIKQ